MKNGNRTEKTFIQVWLGKAHKNKKLDRNIVVAISKRLEEDSLNESGLLQDLLNPKYGEEGNHD